LKEFSSLTHEAEEIDLELNRRTSSGKSKKLPTDIPRLLNASPDIVKRLAIIHQHPGMSHKELCKRLDFDEVPLPERWREKYEVINWRKAYQNRRCRPLVQKLISTGRRKAT
jgi:hypothetical protein